MIDLDKILNEFLGDFNAKQRRVLENRFGLRTGTELTLQKIGDELGITRERVRQIEEQSLVKLRTRVKDKLADVLETVKVYLTGAGGVRRDDYFLHDLRHLLKIYPSKTKYADQKLRFLLLSAGLPFYSGENEAMHSFWYLNEDIGNKFNSFVKQMTKFLERADRAKVLNEKIHLAECRDLSQYQLLTIPKHFGMNVFGDFGLRAWPEIEPRTVRDKAYLVLKKHGRPVHFSDIAKYINRFGIDERAAHVQTVHNELIKDSRFVLVGRGIYALREHGYESGTVREVINRLLKKKGPLTSNEVVKLVNGQRILKENTILLSLQNRRHFRRLNDGRYHIREV